MNIKKAQKILEKNIFLQPFFSPKILLSLILLMFFTFFKKHCFSSFLRNMDDFEVNIDLQVKIDQILRKNLKTLNFDQASQNYEIPNFFLSYEKKFAP